MIKYKVPILSIILILIGLVSTPARAETFPILTWEKGQTQNVVLGNPESNNLVDIYIKSQDGKEFKLAKTTENSEGFSVYSINIANKFKEGGYFVIAKYNNGEIKNVAGVQIVPRAAKEIQRVPFELLFLLLGFTIFVLFIQMIKNSRILELTNKNPTQISLNKTSKLIENKIFSSINFNFKDSLYKKILINEFNLLSKFSTLTSLLLLGTLVIFAYLQLNNSIWITGSVPLVFILMIIANLNISVSFIAMSASTLFMLFNLFTVRNISEVITIFLIGAVFHLPMIYNHLILIYLHTFEFTSRLRRALISAVGALISSMSLLQILILIESLTSIEIRTFNFKLFLSLVLFLVIFAKNLYIKFEDNTYFDEKVFVSISPLSTLITSIIGFLIIFSWSTNFIISFTFAICILLALIFNWLSLSVYKPFGKTLRLPSLIFFMFLSLSTYLVIFVSIRSLPLDAVNQGNLLILFCALFTAVLGIYISISKQTQEFSSKS